ncbi:hypothetical protein ACFYYB_15675 [Streptomyces sp. NPDC002886]|uniref:hypothetical protein n=1 Tax=Streptomyces sp. NPDC002886 TaxID=3364667 RepID=UPI003696104C
MAAVTSLVWVTAGDLERSSQVWGVAGALAGVGALVVGLLQLRVSAAAAAVSVPSVRADGGAIAAGGNVRNAQARDTSPSAGGAPAPGAGPGISATGGAIAAGGDVDGSTAQRGV